MAVTPRGIRNNNPGNIEYHASIPWQGQTGSDGRFATFDTALNGIRALAKQLIIYEDKYGLKTVRGIINRWAPPVENNTSAYVNAVAAAVGVGPDDVISTHGKETLSLLVKAIIQHENGQQPYSDDLIAQAVRAAGGLPDSVGVTKPPVAESPQNLGRISAESPQPRKGMDPLTLVSMLSGVFAPLIRSKLDKALGSDIGKPLADNLLAIASTATGRTDPLEAVAVARQDPAIIAKLQSAAEDWLSQMAPLLDKSLQYDQALWEAKNKGRQVVSSIAIEERKAGLWDMTKWIVVSLLLMLWGIAWGLLGAIVYLAVSGKADGNPAMLTALVGLAGPIWAGAIVASVVAIVAYRFDGSKETSAQTQAIAEVVRLRGGV